MWTTGPGGILILSPAGKHLGTIVPGDVVANCAFGDDGSTLYMTVNHQLMRVRTKTKGLGFCDDGLRARCDGAISDRAHEVVERLAHARLDLRARDLAVGASTSPRVTGIVTHASRTIRVLITASVSTSDACACVAIGDALSDATGLPRQLDARDEPVERVLERAGHAVRVLGAAEEQPVRRADAPPQVEHGRRRRRRRRRPG